jgi:hypothetical protein
LPPVPPGTTVSPSRALRSSSFLLSCPDAIAAGTTKGRCTSVAVLSGSLTRTGSDYVSCLLMTMGRRRRRHFITVVAERCRARRRRVCADADATHRAPTAAPATRVPAKAQCLTPERHAPTKSNRAGASVGCLHAVGFGRRARVVIRRTQRPTYWLARRCACATCISDACTLVNDIPTEKVEHLQRLYS